MRGVALQKPEPQVSPVDGLDAVVRALCNWGRHFVRPGDLMLDIVGRVCAARQNPENSAFLRGAIYPLLIDATERGSHSGPE